MKIHYTGNLDTLFCKLMGGDARAFRTAFSILRPHVYALVRGDRNADDIVAGAFASLHAAIARRRPMRGGWEGMLKWLTVVTKNLQKKHWLHDLRSRLGRDGGQPDEGGGQDQEERYLARDSIARTRELVSQESQANQWLFWARAEGMSYDEIERRDPGRRSREAARMSFSRMRRAIRDKLRKN